MVSASLRNLCLAPDVKILRSLKFFFFLMLALMFQSDSSPLTFCIWRGKGAVDQGFFFSVFHEFSLSIICPKDFPFYPLNCFSAFIEIN